jgi:hypothetical protein
MKFLTLMFLVSCAQSPKYVCKPTAAATWMSYCRNNFEEWVCLNNLDGSVDLNRCTLRTKIRP